MPVLNKSDCQKKRRNQIHWCILGCCLIWFFLGAGCQLLRGLGLPGTVDKRTDRQLGMAYDEIKNRQFTDSLASLGQAYDAIKNQQFSEALSLFENLSRMHPSGSINRFARYGIACTRMITAKTATEMEAAMSDWVYWFQQMSEKYEHEDPRLLDHVLHNYRIQLNNASEQAKKWQIERRWFLTELKKRQEQAETLQWQAETLKWQIDELQRKIEAIETIDQDIQEKKRQIPPPATEDLLGN